MNANEASAGEELVVPHDEVEFGGQEEIYLIVRGRARFLCDGEAIELGEGELLYVRPEVEREATALETPTVASWSGASLAGRTGPGPATLSAASPGLSVSF